MNNEYISGIHYEGVVLKFVSTEASRVVKDGSGAYTYEYTLRGHLGNGRLYFDIYVSGAENLYQYNVKEKHGQEDVRLWSEVL